MAATNDHAVRRPALASDLVSGRPAAHRRAARWTVRVLDRSMIFFLTAALIVAAQLIITGLDVPTYTLPAPLDVWNALRENWSATLWPDTVQTVTEIVIGLSLGLLVGVFIGWLLAESRVAQRFLAPYVILLVSTPLIVFAPLLSTWFGYGLLSKVVMIVLMTFGPMAVNAAAGFQALDREKQELMASLCATRWQTIRKAKFQAALPAIFTGMRISAVMSVIAVVVAEFVGADKGLGKTVYYAQSVTATDLLVAAAVLLVILGLVLYYSVDWLARKVVFWQ
jgi:NitT/TauT family transport system permease protein